MSLEDDRLYTPEELCAANIFGPDTTPGAIRKAARSGAIDFTRWRGRIYLTRANVLANQQAGLREAAVDQAPSRSVARRGRRSPASAAPALPPGVAPLVSKPRRQKAS